VIEEKVRARVQTLAEEARQVSATVGYQDGLKKGFEEAFKKTKQEGSANLEKFTAMVNEAENAKLEIFRANERFLIDLIFRIARMVILKELSTDKEYLLRLAKELVDRVGVRENIKLKIHPDDAKTMDMLEEGLQKAFGKMTNLSIEASSQVQRGGCQIETEWNAIDASIDIQIQGVYDALIGKNAGGAS
jgi:flagellar assembly protein FliH